MPRNPVVRCKVFWRTTLAHLSRGAGSFAAEGLTAISSPLRPPVARRERIYPFRCVALICAFNKAVRSRGFAIVFPLRSLRGRCRLRQMRCNYIRAVGATLFPYISVWSITTGRDTAKNVFVECKIASKKTSIARPILIMCLPDGKDLITPHPSPKVTPSPQATQGKAKGTVCDRPNE